MQVLAVADIYRICTAPLKPNPERMNKMRQRLFITSAGMLFFGLMGNTGCGSDPNANADASISSDAGTASFNPKIDPYVAPKTGPIIIPQPGPFDLPEVGPITLPPVDPLPVPDAAAYEALLDGQAQTVDAGEFMIPGSGPLNIPGNGPIPAPWIPPTPVPWVSPTPIPGIGNITSADSGTSDALNID